MSYNSEMRIYGKLKSLYPKNFPITGFLCYDVGSIVVPTFIYSGICQKSKTQIKNRYNCKRIMSKY